MQNKKHFFWFLYCRAQVLSTKSEVQISENNAKQKIIFFVLIVERDSIQNAQNRFNNCEKRSKIRYLSNYPPQITIIQPYLIDFTLPLHHHKTKMVMRCGKRAADEAPSLPRTIQPTSFTKEKTLLQSIYTTYWQERDGGFFRTTNNLKNT